jgi:hypothetical protein
VPGNGDTHKLAHDINYIGKMMVKQWAWGLRDILFSDPSKKLFFWDTGTHMSHGQKLDLYMYPVSGFPL